MDEKDSYISEEIRCTQRTLDKVSTNHMSQVVGQDLLKEEIKTIRSETKYMLRNECSLSTNMYDRAANKCWRPYYHSDYDSGSESQPLMSSGTSQCSHASHQSFGASMAFMFPDSETSDFEFTQAKPSLPMSLSATRSPRRPFVYQHSHSLREHDDQMSAMTYNRFQYYSKLRTYALDDSALVIPDHVVPFTYFVPYISGAEPKGDGKQGSLITIFAVWNTIMGSSLLTMPWGMEEAGLLMGIFTILSMGALCLYTTHKILQVQKDHGAGHMDWEVAELATLLLGRSAGYIAKLFSLMVLLGAVIVYWVLMSNFLYHTVDYVYEAWATDTSDDFFEHLNRTLIPATVLCAGEVYNTTINDASSTYNRIWNLTTTVPIFLILIIGPLINFKSVSFFTKFNSLGTFSVMYILFFVLTKSYGFGINIDLMNVQNIYFVPLFKASFFALSGMSALSFFIHNIIITIMRNNRNQEKNTRDLSLAYLLVMLTYAFIGVSFYISFPMPKDCIADNLLNNFQNWDAMTVIARVFLLFQLITVYPLIAFMLRSQFFMAVSDDVYPGLLPVLAFNAAIITVCVLFAVFLPSIGTIIRYTGALCGLLYIFTLPILLHLASRRMNGKTSFLSTICYLLIPIIGSINLVGQFFV